MKLVTQNRQSSGFKLPQGKKPEENELTDSAGGGRETRYRIQPKRGLLIVLLQRCSL